MTKISKNRPVSFSFLISHFSFSVALVVALTSCQFEDEDFFDESASLRVEHTNEKVRQILSQPEHGWVMQYFCGSGVAHFEGFNILARFDKGGKVTLAGNHRFLRDGKAGSYTEYSSLYELLLEDGPVLAMNTWNDVLTPFVDPVSPWQAPRALNKDGAGMQGDNNFVIMSYSDDEILLRGERYSGRSRLVPCDRPWEQYLDDCATLKNFVSGGQITSYYITNSIDTLFLTGLSTGRIRYSERLDDPLKNDSLSGIYTPTSLRMEHTDTIGSDPFQEFFIHPDSTCLQTPDGKVRIIASWDSYIVTGRNTLWNFDSELFTAEQKALIEQLEAELKKANKNYSFGTLGLGRSTGSGAVKGLVLTFYTNAAKTKSNTAGMTITTSRPEFGKMGITSNESPTLDRNLTTISAKTDITELLKQFAASLNGTYQIVPNSYFQPTGCELQELEQVKQGDEYVWQVKPGGQKHTLK